MSYVDGIVTAVPVKNKQEYKKLAEEMGHLFKEHGELQVAENWEENVPEGQLTSLPMAVKRKHDEAVVFSWIV